MQAVLILLISVFSQANASELSIRAERDVYKFQAQQSVLFTEKNFQFTRNSNFLCKPEKEVFLGTFSADYGIFEKAEHTKALHLARLGDESSGFAQAKAKRQPHELKIFIDNRDVGSASIAARAAKLMTELCVTSHWKPENAALAKLDIVNGRSVLRITQYIDGKPKAFKLIPVEEANCQVRDTALLCDVAGYGQAYLQEPLTN